MADLHLFTAATMNGYKPVIFMEEAKLDYELTALNLGEGDQFAPDYLKLNPNGKIPTLFDRNEGRPIFESGAILWHLAEKTRQFLPQDPVRRSQALQWLFFQVGHVGPMMGQAIFFQRVAQPNGQEDPFAIRRYVDESRRILEILDNQLKDKDYLIGDYSIADMATYPWARAYPWAKVDISGLDNLQRWFEQMESRPAVRKALTIPKEQPAFWGGEDTAATTENAANFARDVKS